VVTELERPVLADEVVAEAVVGLLPAQREPEALPRAAATVDDWVAVLASCQPADERDDADAVARRTLALATLRGCLLDLLATADAARVDAAMHQHLRLLRQDDGAPG
jgi:hypothetical protein